MGDERFGIDPAFCNETQRFFTVAAVHAACLEGEIFAIHLRQRQDLRLVVQRHHSHNGVGSCALPRQPEGGVRPCHFQHHICPAVVAVGPHKGGAVLRLHGEHLRVVLAEELQAAFVLFAHDDALGAVQHDAQQGADAGRPCAEDQHSILGGDLRDARRPKAGGKDIAHQQRLPVGNAVRDLVQSLICKRHPDIFCLPAIDAAAQRPAAVLVGAVVHKALFAEEALPAEGLHIHSHPVAGLHIGHCAAHFFHDAHHLMAYRDAGHGPGHAAVLDMQIAGTDAGKCHLYNGIPLVLQHRLWFFHQGKLAL